MKFLDLSNDDSMNNNSKIIITAPVKAAGPKYDAMRALLDLRFTYEQTWNLFLCRVVDWKHAFLCHTVSPL